MATYYENALDTLEDAKAQKLALLLNLPRTLNGNLIPKDKFNQMAACVAEAFDEATHDLIQDACAAVETSGRGDYRDMVREHSTVGV